jgi:hypothetical protein
MIQLTPRALAFHCSRIVEKRRGNRCAGEHLTRADHGEMSRISSPRI